MNLRDFGTTGLRVSTLGLGAGQIGDEKLSEAQAARVLHEALALGITFIDTAKGYGLSEERIGRHLSHRRNDFVLSTKVGYGVPDAPDWTSDCVVRGVHMALQTMNTDYIDVVHLHSCPKATLQQGDVVAALEQVKQEGKVRAIAYSGEEEDLHYALSTNRFDSFMMSINLFDQRFIDHGLWNAKTKGAGIIAKRPIANAPWRFTDRPTGQYCEEYWLRWKHMALESDIPWQELALRFVAYTYGVDTCIVGTTNPMHLRQNASIIEKGKLPDDLVDHIRETFRKHDHGWVGQL